MGEETTATVPSEAPSSNGDRPDPANRMRLGGMALRNGLLIHGPTSWALAARRADGELVIASGSKPRAPAALVKIPLLRGPVRLAEGFAFIPFARGRAPGARLPLENLRVVGAAAVVTALSAGLRRLPISPTAREAASAGIGLLPALVALTDRDLAAYHGVEHKEIGGYEQGLDPADVPKEHERCGSHLIAPMLGFSIAAQLAVQRLVERPGRLGRALAGTAAISLAVELFAWNERHPDSALARATRAPGTAIQRFIATREPTPEQMEVGAAALDAVLRAEARNAD